MRAAPQSLSKKNDNRRGLSTEIAAARSYLHSESALSSASAMVSQADRRAKLKKRLLIQQTEKIKDLLWEKASLAQKRGLLDEERRELEALRVKVETEREERQRLWVMEEAMRREEEEEELKLSMMRLKKLAQRYDFDMAKREKMIKSKEMKEWKKQHSAVEQAQEQRRRDMERHHLANGIKEELDDNLAPSSPAPLGDATVAAPDSPAHSASSTESSSSATAPAVAVAPMQRRTSEGGLSTASSASISEDDIARELHAGGFAAKEAAAAPATSAPLIVAVTSASAATSPVNRSEEGLLDFQDDSIANADGLLDDDDVTFLSSSDDSGDDEEKEMSTSRRSSGSAPAVRQLRKAAVKAEKDAELVEREKERERAELEERQRRDAESAKEREERERVEREEQEAKDREWQELKDKLNEAREMQERERLRIKQEREEEQRRVAAKEAEMNELLAKLQKAEAMVMPALPALPALPTAADVAATTSSPLTTSPTTTTTETASNPLPDPAITAPRAATTPETSALLDAASPTASKPSSGSSTPVKALPPLSSISLRSASAALARRHEDAEAIDEPKQAPGALAPLPSLSATPVRRLVSPSLSGASSPPARAKPKARDGSEASNISSMLAELEALEEEEAEEEMVLKMGVDVTKVPRSGKPKVVRMYLDKNEADEWIVRWDSKKKSKEAACILLSQCKVVVGLGAGLFLKPEHQGRFAQQRNCCFSLIAPGRTLDVCTTTFSDQQTWTKTLSRLAKQKKKPTGTAANSVVTSPAQSAAGSRMVSPAASVAGSRVMSPAASVPASRRGSASQSAASSTSTADSSREIDKFLSKHLKEFTF